MKKLLLVSIIIFGLFYVTTQNYASAALVQVQTGFDYPVNQTQITMPNVRAGSLLVVAIRTGNVGATTVTSAGTAWTKNVSQSDQINTWNLDVWSAPNVPGGNTIITITKSGATHSIRAIALEYSGMAASNVVHKVSSATGVSGQANAGSVTTTINGCTLFAVAATDSDLLGWSAGSGYVLRNSCNLNQEPDQKLCTEDRGPVNAGTWPDSFSINSDLWASVLIAFAPSGGTTPPNTAPAVPTGVKVV